MRATGITESGSHLQHCICLSLPSVAAQSPGQLRPAKTAGMQPMWTCNCFACAIQSALLGCLQLLPVHTRVDCKGWVNTVKRFRGYCQWGPLELLKVALIGNIATVLVYPLSLPTAQCRSASVPNSDCFACAIQSEHSAVFTFGLWVVANFF